MKTLKDLDTLITAFNTAIPAHVRVDDLKKMIRAWIKEIRKQEKLHWKYVSNSLGENPSCEIPKGFTSSGSLPSGYQEQIRILQKIFNIGGRKK